MDQAREQMLVHAEILQIQIRRCKDKYLKRMLETKFAQLEQQYEQLANQGESQC